MIESIPEPATRFVGRADELALLAEILKVNRVVTVVGPPGIGKTRLAQMLGLGRAADFPGGRIYCDLTSAQTIGDLISAVADAAQAPAPDVTSDVEVTERVGFAIRDLGAVLITLDNFEQLVEHAPATLSRWLALAPEARFLVTSRQRLDIAGEACLPMPPLSSADAVELFVERARSLKPSLALDQQQRRVIAELVERLDGLPLAIELAAARAAVLTPRQILDRLTERFKMLRKGNDASPDRHATLRSAIDWSWNMLDETERRCLTQCALFKGGFSLEAAEAVLVPPRSDVSVLSTLESLVQRSLLAVRSVDVLDESRFYLLESIREYCDERTQALPELNEVTQRFVKYYYEHALAWAGGSNSDNGPECRTRLELEIKNIYDACGRYLMENPMAVAEMAVKFEPPMSMYGAPDAQLKNIDLAVDAARMAPQSVLARMLLSRGTALGYRGKVEEGLRDFVEVVAVATEAGAPNLATEALIRMAHLELMYDDFPSAEAHLIEARAALADDQGPQVGKALDRLAFLHARRGNYAQALECCEQALANHHRNGNAFWTALCRSHRGSLHIVQGRLERARGDLDAALLYQSNFSSTSALGMTLAHLGLLASFSGDDDDAERAFDESLLVFRRRGYPYAEAMALEWQAAHRTANGDPVRAKLLLERALSLRRAIHHERGQARAQILLALVEAQLGQREPSLACLSAAKRCIDSTNGPEDDRDGLELAQAVVDGAPWSLPENASLLLQLIARTAGHARSPALANEVGGARLELGTDGRWFKLAASEKVSLQRRGPMRLLLLRLAAQHAEAPAKAVTLDELLEHGWPGQRVMPASGAARVYEAIRCLRSLGLRDVLLSHDDGYALHPALEISRE